MRDRLVLSDYTFSMTKNKETKTDKPAPGFDNLVKTLLNTPPSPKEKKDGKRKNRSDK